MKKEYLSKLFISIIVLSVSLFSISITSCSKKNTEKKNYTINTVNGVEIISNETTPSDTSFKYIISDPIIIDGKDSISEETLISFDDIKINENGDIIVLDTRSCYVHKFDKQGKLLKKFGGKGQGPGEVEYPSSLTILNNEIYIKASSYCAIFDINGNYIKNINITEAFPANLYKLNDSILVGDFSKVQIHMGNNIEANVEIETSIDLIDNKFKEIKKIRERKGKSKNIGSISSDMKKVNNILSVYKNKILFSENSVNDFIILCYNSEGNLFRKIKKSFIKVDEKIDTKKITMVSDGGVVKELKRDNSAIEAKYKLAISELYHDKFGNLIVLSPSRNDKGGKYYDIFKEGIFVNRVNFFYDKDNNKLELKFIKNKIVVTDTKNNKLLIYDYKKKNQ